MSVLEARRPSKRGARMIRRPSPLWLLLACGAAACGRVPGQFEIVNNQVPTGDCEIPASDTVYQGQGRLDARLVRSGAEAAFYVFPMMRNNLAGSSEGPDTNQI